MDGIAFRSGCDAAQWKNRKETVDDLAVATVQGNRGYSLRWLYQHVIPYSVVTTPLKNIEEKKQQEEIIGFGRRDQRAGEAEVILRNGDALIGSAIPLLCSR